MMKKIAIVVLMLVGAFQVEAQNNSQLVKHFEAYYKQMKSQGDVQGAMNALTHLIVLQPNQARKDTLAVLYMNNGKHLQALNTIGVEKNTNDSDMAVEVKAVCLQALNQPEKSLEHFEELFKRTPNAMVAYELAELKIQTGDLAGANLKITYGIANSKEGIGRTFYESQQPYQVPMKAAFLYLKSLAKFRENPEANADAAIAILDEAMQLAPNFNLAKISKDALLAQKSGPQKN
jgi:tetratricopeptide (TPR) repeat protein